MGFTITKPVAVATTAIVLATSGGAASASTVVDLIISAGAEITDSVTIPDDASFPAIFRYTSDGAQNILDLSFSGTGFNNGDDLASLSIDVDLNGTSVFMGGFSDLIEGFIQSPEGINTASAGGSIDGFPLFDQDVLTISWTDADSRVSVTQTFESAIIPVPAALPLLAGALGLLGIARRRA